MGLAPARKVLQTTEITGDLRNTIWNVLLAYMHGTPQFLEGPYGLHAGIYFLAESLWSSHLKLPVDEIPADFDIPRRLKKLILESAWFAVYDLIEAIVAYFEDNQLDQQFNVALERELAGYRLIDRLFVPITGEDEIAAIETAMAEEGAPGARRHLAAALAFLSDRKAPDYRNSIKESISAVESVARFSTGNENATLDQALKRLESSAHMHPALRSAFSKLYGYTSDEKGIRHAMLDEPNLTVADAKFFLVACSAFVSYVISNLPSATGTG
jgi:hypothetical protein